MANIRTGEIGTYAQNIQSLYPYPALGFSFFPNPYLLYAVGDDQPQQFHLPRRLQFEVRKRIRNGMQFQANYTFGKALTDAYALRGLDAQLDNANSAIERARADFDLTHAFKLNHYIPLPFGKGQRWHFGNGVLNKIIEGWGLTGFLVIQSGNPVSILSARGTLNRGARSGQNTVDVIATPRPVEGAHRHVHDRQRSVLVEPGNYRPGTPAASPPDGSAPFQGQVFFNPQPGSLGNLQRRSLDGPWFKNYNFSLLKDMKITERHDVELHVDVFNIFNHPNFFISDSSPRNR